MRKYSLLRRIFLIAWAFLMLLPVCAQGADTSFLTCAIVATDDLALRPLELNQRDVVSILDLVYEGLFTLDDDYVPQPKLAYSYEFVSDGRRLRVTLRDDVNFHNGQPLTAHDVVATLDYMYDLAGFDDDLNSEVELTNRGLYYSTFYSIRSWEAQDEHTLLFNLRRASFGSLYALTFPILPAAEVANEMPAGTGPYTYDGYERGSGIWLKANTAWWQRPPQVRNIRANIYKDSEKALTAFDTQDVDIAMTRSINASRYSWTGDYVTVTGDLCADLLSNIASEQRAKVVYEYLYRQIDDKKVRETIDFLLNREEAHNQMFRDAFNAVQESGSNQDFGTTKAAKMYFSLSSPGPNSFANNPVHPPKFS